MSLFSNQLAFIKSQLMPVGTIIEWSPVSGDGTDLSTAAKVAAYYGFGTWEAYGPGRMLLGADSSYAIGSTGGAEQVTLTKENLPSLSGTFYSGSGTYAGGAGTWGVFRSDVQGNVFNTDGFGTVDSVPVLEENANKTDYIRGINFAVGNDRPHGNMPPYITVYRWRRIA